MAKRKLVEQLQTLLGTELSSLNRMTQKDLQKLLAILQEPASLVQVVIRSKKPAIGRIEELLENPLKGLAFLLRLSEKGESVA